MTHCSDHNWMDLNRDPDTGIESLRAHFRGHAYDPHFHDCYLIGHMEHGVAQFHCRKQVLRSTPGNAFLLEPGEIHDGKATRQEGFTYRILYLPEIWLYRQLAGLPPHAYLIQLWLNRARQLLSLGWKPAEVATELCFADQSHLGRWFRRVYKLTPAYYQRQCTGFPDSPSE